MKEERLKYDKEKKGTLDKNNSLCKMYVKTIL